ncbi:hypothetical protein Plim_1114 [Planctopirus limnophila DSM 3776]|uniref:Uncharacterized protein n=1 Tax=Planctopirus limnophila (strain ATCC 43296 / DSM 3776 / IFAM 1008 / Mu 290) TaxID=521674 RepID=D5STW4_PLAL2|nr:hypothetical protein [Planctopirus limnophila]ADG66949.1 hypothetical protein Plim_1114 [Planctopirus limnophila DSM 3776]
MGTTLPMATIMGSGTSQADDLHTDMTFDLASSGFGLHYEITQIQGQSRIKAGSLTEEVVIVGRICVIVPIIVALAGTLLLKMSWVVVGGRWSAQRTLRCH